MNSSSERGVKSKRMLVAFIATFAITMASFLATTLLLRGKAAEIRAAAETITDNAAPSIQKLSSVRTTLRHLEVTLDDYVDRSALSDVPTEEPESIGFDRRSLRAVWNSYALLPTFPGERSLQPGISTGLGELETAIERLHARLRAGNRIGASAGFSNDVKPLFDQIDERLELAMSLNANGSAQAAATIQSIQGELRGLGMALNAASGFLAILAAVVAFRLARQYTRLTDQQIAELELFSGRVAHDIRGPLSSVALALSFSEQSRDPEKTQDVLRRASRTVRRIAELVDGLLLLATAVRSPRTGAVANVSAVLEDLLEEFRPAAQEQQIDLEIAPARSGTVACSAGVLANMIGNLLANALKYMGESPIRRVTVRSFPLARMIRIEVEDTGPGIPRTAQATVFDPHVRAAPANVAGLGLGLATVRRLAEVLGGNAGLVSKDGAGSLLWVELPRAAAPPDPAMVATPPA